MHQHTGGAQGPQELPPFTTISQLGPESTLVLSMQMYTAGELFASNKGIRGNEEYQSALRGPKSFEKTKTAEKSVETQAQRKLLVDDALKIPPKQVALVNPFLEVDVQEHICAGQRLTPHDEIPFVYACPSSQPADQKGKEFRSAATILGSEDGPLPRPAAARRASPEQQPLLPCCFLSGSAALAAQALKVKPGEKVLDLCAGPGGKTLMLACQLFAPNNEDPRQECVGNSTSSTLVCNEPDKGRAGILEDLLSTFVPDTLLGKKGQILVTKVEASHKPSLALQRLGPFDKVLVDPPCCNARSTVGVEKDGKEVKASSELQDEILRCAAELVRPGGNIVYCTSSLFSRENDEVIKKFLRRMEGDFICEAGADNKPIIGAEATEFGTLILPDQGTQHGPLYISCLKRAH